MRVPGAAFQLLRCVVLEGTEAAETGQAVGIAGDLLIANGANNVRSANVSSGPPTAASTARPTMYVVSEL